ncbi:MAG: galactose mutarotase [Chitinophagaceae bacterium]|nr:galactose mutarotase [Chitinophagaceae bacterium]
MINKFKYYLLPLYLVIISSCGNNESKQTNSTNTETMAVLPSAANFDTTLGDKKVFLLYIKNEKGMQAAVTNYGARMVGLLVPDKTGELRDVVLGFDNISDYVSAGERFFGAIVGRFGNRIAKGQFTLDGKSYQLDLNNGPNSLHGGRKGYHSIVWDMKQLDSSSVELTYVSADGDEGYPGTLTVKVIYKITNDNEVLMEYEMGTDKKTVANITNHNYWNLNGEGSGTINDHELMIKAAKYTPVDSTLIPTGIEPVAGTPFDFTDFHKIGERVGADNTQLKYGGGYDHNYVLDKGITTDPELIATVKGDKSGIVMDILTTEPGVQLYGGNFMKGLHVMKNGSKDDYRTAFCLETQHFPDSPNQPDFPSTVLEPGKTYSSKTVCKFSIEKSE